MKLACWLSIGLNLGLGTLVVGFIWLAMTEPAAPRT